MIDSPSRLARLLSPLAITALLGALACTSSANPSAPASSETQSNPAPEAAPAAVAASYSVTLKTATLGKYVVAENGGGGVVNANRDAASGWETFSLSDVNGGDLQDGDAITLTASNGQYFCAENGGGGAINANRATAQDWETFTLHRLAGAGTVKSGDQISLQTKTKGLYVCAINGGGDTLIADRTAVQGWETFVIGIGGTVTPPSGLRLIAYLPNYSGSYGTWAKTIDFTKMTHLNLAFATANSSNGWSMGASDADVKALVDAAHAKGVKVLASLGGGGGDQTVIAQFKNAANIPALVSNLDTFVTARNFDGVDIDIEDGNNLGANYSTFVASIVSKLRPKGKLVTAAVAQYLQGSMSDATLNSFDFINVMIYSNYNDTVNAMTFYASTKGIAKSKLVLGAGFFGQDSNWNEYAYKDILAADSSAWNKDQAYVNGMLVNYTGMASMMKLADYSKGFGGIMFWELSEDTTDSHSLYKVLQGAM